MTAPDSPAIHLRLRLAAERLGPEPVALGHLADAHGPSAHGTLMILLAAPCMLPVPGVGTVLGMGLFAMALALWRGQGEPGLPVALRSFSMSSRWAGHVLRLLAGFHGLAGRWARARLSHWAGPARQRWWAGGAGTMAMLIVLPIPMGNVLPATALMLLGLGLVFRDGVVLMLAIAMAALALGFTAMLGWLAWHWGLAPLLQWLPG